MSKYTKKRKRKHIGKKPTDDIVVDLSELKLKTNNSIRNRAVAKKLASVATEPEKLRSLSNKATGLKGKRGLLRMLAGEMDIKSNDEVGNMKSTPPPVPYENEKDRPPSWVQLLEQELPDDKLLDKHNQLLEADSEKIQMEALKEAYKVKGKIAPEKIEHSFRPFEDMGDDELDKKLEEAERSLNRAKRVEECDIIDTDSVS